MTAPLLDPDRPWRMLIDGRLAPAATGATYETVSPYTLAPVGRVPEASGLDVDAAVAAGVRAFGTWRFTSAPERAAAIRRLATILLEHEEELGMLDAIDGGNPVTAMRGDVRIAADIINLFANWALELKGETIPATASHLHYTVREPYGVVARIVPYNHPLMFAAGRIAAPLIAGNCVVLKAPDQTPLSALRMGELFADALPPGVLNVITGPGSVAGEWLVRHPDVRRIAFIGSVATGQRIQRSAAESGIKHVTTELGGKNPLIVFPDADLEAAAAGIVRGMNFHWSGGQSCGSASRVLLHTSIADEVLAAVVDGARAVRMGSPLDDDTEMGTMVSQAHHERVTGFIDRAVKAGATVLAGGGRPEGVAFAQGWFISPTVLGGVTPGMEIAREEVFGPVLSVLTYETEDEAVEIANGTEYGLTASVWTSDLARAHRLVRTLDAGYIWVNSVATHYLGVPFGGFKNSGIGREEGIEELLSFTQTKSVSIPVG